MGKGHGWEQVCLEDLIGTVDAALAATDRDTSVDTTGDATADLAAATGDSADAGVDTITADVTADITADATADATAHVTATADAGVDTMTVDTMTVATTTQATANATVEVTVEATVVTAEPARGLAGTSRATEPQASRPAAVVDAASPGAPGEASGTAVVLGDGATGATGATGAEAVEGDPAVAAGSGGVGAARSPGGAAAAPAAGRLAAPGPDPEASAPRLASPRQLLILDTETTALSPQQGSCIEVGAVLFDVASRAILMQVSFLLPCQENPALAINGIPAAVTRLPQPWQSGLACFQAMLTSADAVLAHNVSFDRQWFGQAQLPPLTRPWICSMEDIRWPADRQLRARPSVRDLALAYGVPVWAAHRALTDCTYLVQVLQRCPELELLLQQALEPRRLVRARVSYDERQLAKEAGFRWNEPVRGAWSRRLSEREIAALPFAVDPIEASDPQDHPAGAA